MPEKLTVKVERRGPSEAELRKAAQRALRHPRVRAELDGAPHRLLALQLLEPERKSRTPPEPDRFRATVYDYANDRTLHVDGRLTKPDDVRVATSAAQPRPSREEFEAAVQVLKREQPFGDALGKGKLLPYAPMPPLHPVELPDGRLERHVNVGLRPANGGGGHEIVAVNLQRGEVKHFEGGAPPTALAAAGLCGVPNDAGQATAARGAPGQAWVTVLRGREVLWRFLVVRPAASSGHDGSAVELRYVDYRGRRVLYQAHVPILNVRYVSDKCGPYRDWQWQEGMIQAAGRNVAPGFRLCPRPARTILESGTDTGDFLGVGIYVAGEEVVLVSELEAGWYRYVSEWRLHADGTIRPRFAFGATSSSCVCNLHHHHTYWRLDFDIGGPARNGVREFNDPPLTPGAAGNWHPNRFEVMRLRDPARKRRWRVANAAGNGYEIVPGEHDGTAAGDAYARGDVWIMRYRPGQVDDYPYSNTEAELGKLVNHESVERADVVLWYGAHFTHDVHDEHAHHVVGPDLVPHDW